MQICRFEHLKIRKHQRFLTFSYLLPPATTARTKLEDSKIHFWLGIVDVFQEELKSIPPYDVYFKLT